MSVEGEVVDVRHGNESGEYLSEELKHAASLLAAAQDVTLLGHVNPDADAFGSAVALGMALRDRGVAVRVSFGTPNYLPDSLRHLDPAGLYVPAGQVPVRTPLLVVLDSGDIGRLGPLADRVAATIDAGGDVLVIDHHVANHRFGTCHLVDEHAEATATLVLRLLDALGAPLTEPIARALYAGLLTDTSSFRRATASTHRAAARLLAAGVDAEATARPLLDTHPFGWLKMLSAVLGRAELEPDCARGLGLTYTVVRIEDAAGLRAEEVESVINIVRSGGEAEVAAVLKQVGPQQWSGSLRALGRLDVSAAARAMGGGGHRRAAGFTAFGSADEVLGRLRTALDAAPFLKP